MTGIVQNGPVFKARRNRDLLVLDWVPVVHEKHNFNLGVEQKKKAGIKLTEQRIPKTSPSLTSYLRQYTGTTGWLKKKILAHDLNKKLGVQLIGEIKK